MIDSTPVFRSRVRQFGLDEVWPRFVQSGWETFGDYAFATTWVPGSSEDSDFKLKVIQGILGASPQEEGEASQLFQARSVKLRRLFVEAYTLFTADQQRRVSNGDDEDKPRKLAKEERAERLEQVTKELELLDLTDEPELIPSYKVTDTFAAMKEAGDLRPVNWEDLTTRTQEKRAIKKDPQWSMNAQGKLLLTESNDGLRADTSNEARIMYMLQRRGVALQLARLASYKTHNKIVKMLMKEYKRSPPTNFFPVSIEQIHTADHEIFMRMSELTENGLDTAAPGTYPLDVVIEKVILEPRIQSLLNPFPMAKGGGGSSSGVKRDSDSQVIQELRAENKRLRGGQQSTQKPAGGKKGKRKGNKEKGKKQGDMGMSTRMPKALIGLKKDYNGKPFCYGFNLEGCPAKSNCTKGEHRCMKCGSPNHGAKQCTE